jgi:cysteine desulfurase
MFTGGGTESINTAIRSMLAGRSPRRKIVTSTVEHSATRELCAELARQGLAEIVEVGVDGLGRLDEEYALSVLDDSVALASFIWANNETGVVWDLGKIIRRCRELRVPVHVDGTQMVGKVAVDVHALEADMVSFASHKFHGPKGVGGLYVRKGLRLRPAIIGGPQEKGRRGGTENVPGIAGMGAAAEVARARLGEMKRVAELRDRLEAGLLERVEEASVNGDVSSRLPNTTNISFARLEAEAILLLLSERGVCASAGAACSSGSLEPSHVLRAMGIEPRVAHGAIRFSLSRETTEGEIERALEIVPAVVGKLRQVLPVG